MINPQIMSHTHHIIHDRIMDLFIWGFQKKSFSGYPFYKIIIIIIPKITVENFPLWKPSIYLVGGWATPLKNMNVSWDDEIPNICKNKKWQPNHQPD